MEEIEKIEIHLRDQDLGQDLIHINEKSILGEFVLMKIKQGIHLKVINL